MSDVDLPLVTDEVISFSCCAKTRRSSNLVVSGDSGLVSRASALGFSALLVLPGLGMFDVPKM
jgi:hypothetical protein